MSWVLVDGPNSKFRTSCPKAQAVIRACVCTCVCVLFKSNFEPVCMCMCHLHSFCGVAKQCDQSSESFKFSLELMPSWIDAVVILCRQVKV
eukprot:1512686-Amphidinium_carterae.2